MDYPGKVITKNQVTPTQTSASGNWTLDDAAAATKNNNWPVALVPNPISKSLRFNSADSAYLNRTPASAGNRKTWTWSGWVKRGALANGTLFDGGSTGPLCDFQFNGDQLRLYVTDSGVTTSEIPITTAVFRDPSAWYHIVLAVDTTQATTANRVKIYVNGVLQTITGLTGTLITQNADLGVNRAVTTNIGYYSYGSSQYLDGYLTEVNFIDGQALTPSDFGLTNPQTGQWIPKKYAGTYGTNGFYLNFKDATSTTTLGYDYSGNANNWTTNNFSVTAGSGNDSLTDVPTPWIAYNTTGDVGGVVRGNYATLNPIGPGTGTIANGNLQNTSGTTTVYSAISTISVDSGKWYWEVTATAVNGTNFYPFIGAYRGIPNTLTGAVRPGADTGINGFSLRQDGTFRVDGTNTQTISSFTTNDVLGIALDLTNLEVKFYKNGTLVLTQTGLPAGTYTPADSEYNGSSVAYNFGQRPFAYTPPAGFLSLCSTNLPTPTIGFGLTNQGDDYFDVSLWTGNGTSQSITNSGSMQPDFVWIKDRSAARSHILTDAVRGVTKQLYSNETTAEATDSNRLTAFNSNGFSVGTGLGVNANTETFVGWQWKAGGTGVTNTAGSITSTVSANTTSGFSVVTYTGTGANATVGHGLGVAPSMVIIKGTGPSDWYVGHTSVGWSNTGYLILNTTGASGQYGSIPVWQSTAPSSTVITLGTTGGVNTNGVVTIAYCFAAIAGYSAFGSYTGNGSADGPFVFCGFRPRYVLWKRTDGLGDWSIMDTARWTYNACYADLNPNNADAEAADNFNFDILSNGFKVRSTYGAQNANGGTYIYAAFAESPFKFANAR